MININIPIMMESVTKESLFSLGNGNNDKHSKVCHIFHLSLLLPVVVLV